MRSRKQLVQMKILVVEDEKGMAQVLRRGLEEDNHALLTTAPRRSLLPRRRSSTLFCSM